MLSVSEASAQIMARATFLGAESVPLDETLARVLAADVLAPRDLPPRDNSAMDGYAVLSADLPGRLPIAAEVAAGAGALAPHRPGSATRIMTGAPLPPGADTVVMRENVTVEGNDAVFSAAEKPGKNIRRAGEDIAEGALAIGRGTLIGAGEIGLLAALGHPRVMVGKRPRVSILSTGDELIEVIENPPIDRIINSNAHALAAQVRLAGGIPVRCPIVGDDKLEVIDAIANALEDADILLTSGGVSVGDYDFVKEALAANGIEPDFWEVAVKPGKPLVFGQAQNGALVFGLPGNPVSSMVTFELFVRPALLRVTGAKNTSRPRARVKIDRDLKKDATRTHFLRANLRAEGNVLHANLFSKQGSGMLTSMSGADALVIVPQESLGARAGEELEAIVLRPPQ